MGGDALCMVRDALSLGRVQLHVRDQPEPSQGVINGSRLYEGWEGEWGS